MSGSARHDSGHVVPVLPSFTCFCGCVEHKLHQFVLSWFPQACISANTTMVCLRLPEWWATLWQDMLMCHSSWLWRDRRKLRCCPNKDFKRSSSLAPGGTAWLKSSRKRIWLDQGKHSCWDSSCVRSATQSCVFRTVQRCKARHTRPSHMQAACPRDIRGGLVHATLRTQLAGSKKKTAGNPQLYTQNVD